MFRKRIQLGLIHVAVAMTLVPINSTLNRIMIKELAISATLVAVFASLPYLFSPIQVAIGSFADRNPILGRRRIPYIALGLLLCVGGVIVSPQAAFALHQNPAAGLGLSVLAFGAWGMGFNFATVSYFALASEISGAKGRSRTIAIMFFMMIIGIIFTAASLGQMLDPYSPEALHNAFWWVGGIALVLGVIGMVGLEEKAAPHAPAGDEHHGWGELTRAITSNPQAKLFFWYLILLLTAILGQDILLEPYGAEAFGLSVEATTRITSVWGGSFLVSLAIAGLLEQRTNKVSVSKIGVWGAVIAFSTIIASGLLAHIGLFYAGVVLLGLATGLSTVSNLSLMLDMITEADVGLFIGAWGMANAFSRLTGNLLGGVVRDAVTGFTQNLVGGYQVVFFIEAILLLTSLFVLQQIDVTAFKRSAERQQPSLAERAALAGEM